MAESRHIENRLWLYLHELLSDWRDIWHVQVEPCSDTRHMTKIAIFENSRWRTAAILKMVLSLGLFGGQPPYWKSFLAISPWVIVWLTRYLVCTSRTILRHTPQVENSNFRKFKMADGRHFENGFITISQPRIIRYQWNLVSHCIFCF